MPQPELFVTLWPSFPHFDRFSRDSRIAGIRLNSAMISNPELEKELVLVKDSKTEIPMYFDAKARQLRVEEVHENPDYLDISLNHPISVQTPCIVLFKQEIDQAMLAEVTEGGRRLKFSLNPRYNVRPGESLHIRHSSLQVHGPNFTDIEKEKIRRVREFGFRRYFLSYVENQSIIDEFLEMVGSDAEVFLKIENERGLEFVASEFQKRDGLYLVAARGDLYVELDRPHKILQALKLIISKDPEACVGSRILLSIIGDPVPSCADFLELAWLYDIGYRKMMLCDEICLREEWLGTAINAFDSFRNSYPEDQITLDLRDETEISPIESIA
ncbi:MAG: hypothetical protein G01um101420_136 [Parcubacteria group bacterium Gr01-1014_20]|nr:MAG: hypothetical protein G01um101420_136 [Parcubacteria group bacterium Gr01-1014_20]